MSAPGRSKARIAQRNARRPAPLSPRRWPIKPLLAGALLWAGLGSGAAQPLSLALSRTSLSLPLYVAEAQHYFEQAGVVVQTHECLGGQRCIAEMLDGKADLATATELPVAFQSFKRADFAIFATFVSTAQDAKVIVRKSGGLQTLAQLVGKRVATTPGTSAHYYLDSALLFHGIDPQQLEMLGLPPEQVGPALRDGRADAAVIWEPFAYETLRALGPDARLLPAPRIFTATFNLVAKRSLIGAREADLVKLLQAVARAVQFISEQPAQAQAILKARLGVDQGFIDATWQDYQYRLALSQSLVGTLEGQARWALREGHVAAGNKVANMLQFVETGPLRKVLPAAVSLVK